MKKLLIIVVFVITAGNLTAQNNDCNEQQKIGYISSDELIKDMPDYMIMYKEMHKLHIDYQCNSKKCRTKFPGKWRLFNEP